MATTTAAQTQTMEGALALSAAFRLELSDVVAGLFFAILLSGVALRTYGAEYVTSDCLIVPR